MSILVSGYYGFGNFGDELILQALSQQWRSPLTPLTALSERPAFTTRTQGVSAVSRWNPIAVWRSMREAKGLISGGGGLLQDATSPRSVWYYLEMLQLAKQFGLPTAVWNQGLGPLRGSTAIREVLRTLKGVDVISVRDESSRDWLIRHGMSRSQVRLGADPGWIYSWPASSTPPSEWSTWPRPLIGICPRPHHTFLEALREFHSSHHGTAIWLAAHPSTDRPLIARLSRQLQVQWPIYDLLSPFEGCATIRHLDGLISARYHPILIALRCGLPVIPVTVDPKIKFLLMECGMATEDYFPVNIPRWSDWRPLPSHLPLSIARLQERAEHSVHDLMDTFGRGITF